MTFSEKLKRMRKERGISQATLAKNLGVSQSSVNYWEKGERIPSIEAVKRIATAYLKLLFPY